ncbi:hypothetical protein SISNIDRAFT_298008 [Sistotremastrum niveocremeum HHB9708]|uniref:Uncharacterized protein n=2 Tax=Sistotremastraceae TaxID=3402574 RepID=A0A164NHZ8_9AGAM|nr:hypothetical protein SISNIDRAFT_298008 [Sistotremastrum niveocremeum HHB9708]KZT35353.1 hypothetical protein SISSUDRAFT_173623 [Sistotremastrum suecicum HHB10207 ss-3]
MAGRSSYSKATGSYSYQVGCPRSPVHDEDTSETWASSTEGSDQRVNENRTSSSRAAKRIAIEKQSHAKKIHASRDLVACVRQHLHPDDVDQVRGLADAAKKAIVLLNDAQSRERRLKTRISELEQSNKTLTGRLADLDKLTQDVAFWQDVALRCSSSNVSPMLSANELEFPPLSVDPPEFSFGSPSSTFDDLFLPYLGHN